MKNKDLIKKLIDYLSSDSLSSLDCNIIYSLCDEISYELWKEETEWAGK